MTRWPTRASFSVTPEPTAATMPQGSWPAIIPASRLMPPVTAPAGCAEAR